MIDMPLTIETDFQSMSGETIKEKYESFLTLLVWMGEQLQGYEDKLDCPFLLLASSGTKDNSIFEQIRFSLPTLGVSGYDVIGTTPVWSRHSNKPHSNWLYAESDTVPIDTLKVVRLGKYKNEATLKIKNFNWVEKNFHLGRKEVYRVETEYECLGGSTIKERLEGHYLLMARAYDSLLFYCSGDLGKSANVLILSRPGELPEHFNDGYRQDTQLYGHNIIGRWNQCSGYQNRYVRHAKIAESSDVLSGEFKLVLGDVYATVKVNNWVY